MLYVRVTVRSVINIMEHHSVEWLPRHPYGTLGPSRISWERQLRPLAQVTNVCHARLPRTSVSYRACLALDSKVNRPRNPHGDAMASGDRPYDC